MPGTAPLRAIAVLTGALFVIGCAPAESFEAYFEDHERAFALANPFSTHRVPRDGYRLHAREFGGANAGKGAAIVVMHGFPDSLHLYDRLAPRLGAGRRVIAFDFLGWGDSDKPAKHTYDSASLRRDLEAVIAYFGLKSVTLVAHDSSGPPAIDWALDNPDRVATLVLLNTYYGPMPGLKPPPAIARFATPGVPRDLAVWGARRSDGRWQAGVMEQLGEFFTTPEARDVYVKVFAHQSLAIRPAFFGLNAVLFDEVRRRRAATPRLKAFPRPVRIVFGADDPYLNVGVAREFGDLFPNSEVFAVEAASHYVQLDQADKVAKLILAAP